MEGLHPNLQWMKNANRLVINLSFVNFGFPSFASAQWKTFNLLMNKVAVVVKLDMNLASFEYSQYSKYVFLQIVLD